MSMEFVKGILVDGVFIPEGNTIKVINFDGEEFKGELVGIGKKKFSIKDPNDTFSREFEFEDIEKIIGLEVGADDYLAKPFNPRELLARIRAVLRRPKTETQDSIAIDESKLHSFGPFKLNLNNHSLVKGSQLVELTSGEFDLLAIFIKNANQVLSRDQLIDQLKGYERSPFDRSIDVRVTRLRKKLGHNAYIQTIRGTGYLFIPDPEQAPFA